MAQASSRPSTKDVIAATGGHPGNPWREQRLLFLYQTEADKESETVAVPATQPLATAA